MAGQPTKMTPATLTKLEEIFELGGSDLEACKHAGIRDRTLYRYQEENPEYCHRKEMLKQSPTLKARRILNKDLDDGDSNTAKWYLERKKKDEFSPRTDLKHENDKDNPITPLTVVYTTAKERTDGIVNGILNEEKK